MNAAAPVHFRVLMWFTSLVWLIVPVRACAVPPAAPAEVHATDNAWDKGRKINVTWTLAPGDAAAIDHMEIAVRRVLTAHEREMIRQSLRGTREEALSAGKSPTEADAVLEAAVAEKTAEKEPTDPVSVSVAAVDATSFIIPGLEADGQYVVLVRSVTKDGESSAYRESVSPAVASKNWFDKDKLWLLIMVVLMCSSVLLYIHLARMGRPMWVRRIAAIDAVAEAVGRATEMGRPCFFVPGVQDMDDMGTVAGVSVLGRIAKTAAEYGADLEVPTSKGLVMTACSEAMQAAYCAAGRPDEFNPAKVSYITDDQFGYVAYLVGQMSRRKPAACFYMGTFFAESLLLAETGNSIGAIQIAGTRETSQLPFFVAACDYTLIGEEFFAASAYLSGQPDQLGSLKGQDLGKAILASLIIVGVLLATLSSIFGSSMSWAQNAAAYLQDTILSTPE